MKINHDIFISPLDELSSELEQEFLVFCKSSQNTIIENILADNDEIELANDISSILLWFNSKFNIGILWDKSLRLSQVDILLIHIINNLQDDIGNLITEHTKFMIINTLRDKYLATNQKYKNLFNFFIHLSLLWYEIRIYMDNYHLTIQHPIEYENNKLKHGYKNNTYISYNLTNIVQQLFLRKELIEYEQMYWLKADYKAMLDKIDNLEYVKKNVIIDFNNSWNMNYVTIKWVDYNLENYKKRDADTSFWEVWHAKYKGKKKYIKLSQEKKL